MSSVPEYISKAMRALARRPRKWKGTKAARDNATNASRAAAIARTKAALERRKANAA